MFSGKALASVDDDFSMLENEGSQGQFLRIA
jgi:hypothetical protein